MKTEHKTFLLGILVGLAYWVVDALMGFAGSGATFIDELARPASAHAFQMRILTLIVCTLFGGVLAYYVRRRRLAVEALGEHDARLTTTLRSIGDAVISTDADGRVAFMNDMARDLTGWDDDAIGRPMDEVFRIVNARTRQPADNPVDRVLAEGVVVGSANHTVLIARDGREYQITDSAAPIREESGALSGVVLVFRDVTEAYRRDEALRVSEQRYRSLFSSLGEGFALHEIVCDDEGNPCDYRFLEVNPAFERFTGLKRDDILGRTILDVLPGTERHWIDTYGKVALTGEAVQFEQYAGELGKHFEVIAYRPAERQFACLFVDVTRRRQAEQRVEKLNSVLRSIRNVNQLITRQTDRDKLLEGVCECLVGGEGYRGAWIALRDDAGALAATASAGVGDGLDRLAEQLGADQWPQCWQRAGHAAGPVMTEPDAEVCGDCPMLADACGLGAMSARLAHGGRDFGLLVVSVDPAALTDPEHRDLFDEVATDIALALSNIEAEHRSRHAEDQLAHSESLLSNVFEASFDGISITERLTDPVRRRLVSCNDRFVQMSGRTREELMAAEDLNQFVSYVHLQADAERRHREGLARWGVSAWIRPDGQDNSFEWTAAPLQHEGRTYYVSVDRDITERMREDAELRAQRDRARHYMNVAKVIFVALDTDGVVTLINKMGCDVLGCAQEQILGVRWYEAFIPPARRQVASEGFRRILAGDVESEVSKEGTILTATGEERVIVWHNSLTYDNQGSVTGMLSSGLDITDQRQTEEQLRQAQKMEAIGRLAGGIAHDFNNQLTVIQGYCGMLQDQLALGDEPGECVQQIKKAADRAGQLTGQLLAYSRRQVLRNEVVPVNQMLSDLLDPLGRMIGEDIRLSLQLEDDAGNVLTDPVQLQQVLMNMAVNARDAMPDGGTLTVGTQRVRGDDEVVRRNLDNPAGEFVLLWVRDTGVGMPEQVRQRVFEPFFTTKPTGQGTGLGLAMAYGFVTQSGGFIDVGSEPGQGACFGVYLPRTEQAAEAKPASPAVEEFIKGTGTVLVAEDEPAVRAFVIEVLKRCGYTVLACADADEAMAEARRHDGPIDLLVTDVIMPGRSGPELAAAIRQDQPGLKILYISGYTEDAAGRTRGGELDGPLLPKPFGPDQLAATVHQVLHTAGPEDA